MRSRTKLCLTCLPLLATACSSASGDPSARATAASEIQAGTPSLGALRADPEGDVDSRTPIRHLVVIFQENVSFDHYFGTYPQAANPPGEPRFVGDDDTPTVNGLTSFLLTANPNGVNPPRVDRANVTQCDQDHEYLAEQQAYDNGLADGFIKFTANTGTGCDPAQVMSYFDGNTVTALWNYAQHFAMSDNSFDTTYGPSTPGALNLISGQTHGATPDIAGDTIDGTVIADPQPTYDDCTTRENVAVTGTNVGDLLSAKGLTWGWFQGGFAPQAVVNGRAQCTASDTGRSGKPK